MKHFKKIFFALPLLFVFVLAGCSNSNPESSQVKSLKNTQSTSSIIIEQNNIDLGEIPIMGGKVDANFSFTNMGNDPVALFEGETSCMCTEAVVKSADGITSPRIQMPGHGGQQVSVNQVLEPGETATLIATFDPLAHGPNATGAIKRDVFIKTNSKANSVLQFSFQGNVIKGGTKTVQNQPKNNDINNNAEVFAFKEKSYDFGIIKQSGEKVSHEFLFTYNGKEPIQITGVPTSCACTSAKVEPTQLNPGDTGILTVKFNPNLHEEPEGKFFKTVSLLTTPSLEEIPEVKIWTEIDLDLGEEAFELKSDHDESEEEEHEEPQYNSITPEVFGAMLKEKDFVLIDTHIPEQNHIAGTDEFIPYDEILQSSKLPTDKNTKIVLYCRSGSMSRAAAYQLAEEGYTNVYDLVGGKIAYDELFK